MEIVKCQSWYDIEENGETVNNYPIIHKKVAVVALHIAELENKDINTAIDLATDRINFFR